MITRVAVEHLEFFSSIDEIALAERELIENLPWPQRDGGAERGRRARGAIRGSGARAGALVCTAQVDSAHGRRTTARARNFAPKISKSAASTAPPFDFVSPAGRARLELPLIGRHNVMNAVAALAAASVWGIGAADAQSVFPAAAARGQARRSRAASQKDLR